MSKQVSKTIDEQGKWQEMREGQMTEVIVELSKKVPGQVAPYVKQAAPYLAKAAVMVMLAAPYVMRAIKETKDVVERLPDKVVLAIIGFVVCFFGGVFPATIAAVEAWIICGGPEAWETVKMLYAEWQKVGVENIKDDLKDDDKDGVPDVLQIPPQELILRKSKLVMSSVDPEKVSTGLVSLYTGWIGVLAVLKIQFAMTVTLGERIGGMMYKSVSRLEPTLQESVPEEYRKWVPVCTRWACKLLAMSIAWWITRAVAAVHSAMRGGQMCAKYVIDYLHERQMIKSSSEELYWDEALGWSLCVAGLLFQFAYGFGVPFPLNVLLWPVQLLEGFIVYSVSA